MSFALRISGSRISTTPKMGSNKTSLTSISRVTKRFYFPKSKNFSNERFKLQRLCSTTGNGDVHAYGISDSHNCYADKDGSRENNANQQANSFTSNELMKRLRRYGVSGVLSYGILNTIYYLTTFLLAWFYFAPAPGKMGYAAAVKRFLKLMAMVWAGSQVTKLVRAGGALALAPFVDRGLSWFTAKFKFKSQGKAFMAIVGLCFGLALVLFFVVTLLAA